MSPRPRKSTKSTRKRRSKRRNPYKPGKVKLISFPRSVATQTLNKTRPQIMKFTRTLQNFFAQQTGGTGYYEAGFTINTNLSAFPNTVEFQNLFSKYRITKLAIVITMNDTPPNDILFPTINLWRNKQAGLVTPTQVICDQVPNVLNHQFSNEHRRLGLEMKPYILGQVFSGGFDQIYDKWIDLSYPSISYYGFSVFISDYAYASTAVEAISYDLVAEIECMTQK